MHCLTLSDFGTGNFNSLLENEPSMPLLRTVEVPFGQVHQMLANPAAPCWQNEIDCLIVWTQPQAVAQQFARALEGESAGVETLLSEVDGFAGILAMAAARVRVLLVPSWTLPAYEHGFGLLDLRPGLGLANMIMQMNLRLAEHLVRIPNAFVLNAQRWMESAGARAYNPKLWYLSKIPFGNEVFRAAITDVKAALRAVNGEARKLVLLDLDETLWGGVVGDLGWENLSLGGHDAEGEALVDFQRALKALRARGVLLGIVSKNTERIALEAIDKHPDMVLRREDFAGWRINWGDKAQNIVDLTNELNLGLQSVVFIDDNPVERARIAETLPEVLVPEWPIDKTQYRKALRQLTCFDVPNLTEEDRERAGMYSSQRSRNAVKATVTSVDDWIESLETTIDIQPLSSESLPRAAQLLNKTNQMNLATRRMTEAELMAWATQEGRGVWTLRVTDKFGSLGLTGLLSLEHLGDETVIVDYVLSCRVMGRYVEETMLAMAVDRARAAGAKRLVATYLPTAKNEPCLSFFKRSGMEIARTESTPTWRFIWDTSSSYPYPKHIVAQQQA